MRFLFLTQYFPPEIGAPQVRLSAMTRQLVHLGHEAEVVTAMPNHPTGRIFTTYRRKLYQVEDVDDVRIHRVWVYASVGAGIKRMINYLSFMVMSILGLIRAKKPDCIFVESPPLFLGIPAYIFSRIWRVPFIFNVADLWPDSVVDLGLMNEGLIIRMTRMLEKWTYRKASYVNAVTEGIREVLLQSKNVPEYKVSFLPNGVDTELFKPSREEDSLADVLNLTNKKVIVYAGTLGFAQGLETALQSMQILQTSHPEVTLVFIGDGSERKRLIEISEQMNLGNVKFMDPHPLAFIAKLYSIAYAGFASLKDIPLFEGARPSKIFPIMSSGKPVIYSGSGEGANIIKKARAGVVVHPEQSAQLAEAIQNLVENEHNAIEMGRNGRRYIESNLSWESLIGDWTHWLSTKIPLNKSPAVSSDIRNHSI